MSGSHLCAVWLMKATPVKEPENITLVSSYLLPISWVPLHYTRDPFISDQDHDSLLELRNKDTVSVVSSLGQQLSLNDKAVIT